MVVELEERAAYRAYLVALGFRALAADDAALVYNEAVVDDKVGVDERGYELRALALAGPCGADECGCFYSGDEGAARHLIHRRLRYFYLRAERAELLDEPFVSAPHVLEAAHGRLSLRR